LLFVVRFGKAGPHHKQKSEAFILMQPLNIAAIGGGSTYTPELVEGFIRSFSELPIRRISLMDISEERLQIVGDLVQRMLGSLPVTLVRTTDRREAIEGADFVISQMRIGGLAARALDEQIPLRYGILGQETTGPGGFAKALRTIPVMLDVARDIGRYAPNAWLINFTNPAGLIVEAIMRHSQPRVIGLCNVPINMQMKVAKALSVAPERVELRYVGLNHLSWAKVLVDGQDVTQDAMKMEWGGRSGTLDADYLRALGMLPNYYLRYFAHPDRVLDEQLRAEESRAEYLQGVEAELLDLYRDPNLREKPKLLETRGGAYYSTVAVQLIRAIAQDRREVHIVNTRNGSCLPDLPPEAVVEVPSVIGKSGAHPLASGVLPPAIRALAVTVKAYEELTIEAAITGNEETAKMALLTHPLVPSWDVATALWNDIKAAHRAYLPQFR
jgi:6-phospho-beta-glucosidase